MTHGKRFVCEKRKTDKYADGENALVMRHQDMRIKNEIKLSTRWNQCGAINIKESMRSDNEKGMFAFDKFLGQQLHANFKTTAFRINFNAISVNTIVFRSFAWLKSDVLVIIVCGKCPDVKKEYNREISRFIKHGLHCGMCEQDRIVY